MYTSGRTKWTVQRREGTKWASRKQISLLQASYVGLLGQLETRDESREREADKGEEGHANRGSRRVGEHIIRALSHAVGDRDRSGQRGHQKVRCYLQEQEKPILVSMVKNSVGISDETTQSLMWLYFEGRNIHDLVNVCHPIIIGLLRNVR